MQRANEIKVSRKASVMSKGEKKVCERCELVLSDQTAVQPILESHNTAELISEISREETTKNDLQA